MNEEIEIGNDVDINKALNEFAVKSQVDNAQLDPSTGKIVAGPSGMTKLVMKLSGGVVKNENQATYVLLCVAIILFIVSMYTIFGHKSPTTDILDQIKMQGFFNN